MFPLTMHYSYHILQVAKDTCSIECMIYYTCYSSDMSVHMHAVTVGDVGSILFYIFYILGLFSLVTYVFVMCGHKIDYDFKSS